LDVSYTLFIITRQKFKSNYLYVLFNQSCWDLVVQAELFYWSPTERKPTDRSSTTSFQALLIRVLEWFPSHSGSFTSISAFIVVKNHTNFECYRLLL
jgi:hypothetical protein